MQSSLPVLMLTARGDDVDSVVGLELGADDYLAKPSSPRVMVARIRAILRRAEAHPGSLEPHNERPRNIDQITLDDLVIHSGSRTVMRGGSAHTYDQHGIQRVGCPPAGSRNVVPKANLSEQALGRKLSRYDRSLDMHVSNLSKKLGPFLMARSG